MACIIYILSTLYLVILLALQTIRVQAVKSQAIAGEDQRQFADSVTNELYVNDNECTSLWGVSMVFDLLRPGATSGDTLDQMCDIVGLCGSRNVLLWNDTVMSLTTSYAGECTTQHGSMEDGGCYQVAPLIKIAISAWIDIDSKLQPDYEEVVGEYLHSTDFTSQGAGGVVNTWVNSSTMGLIESIIDKGPLKPYRLLAMNTIYLKAYWQQQFLEQKTNQDVFYTDASRRVALPNKAQFMHAYSFGFPYSDTLLPGYQVVELPYQRDFDDELSMILVLPLFTDAASVPSNQVVNILPLPTSVNPTEEKPWGQGVALAIPKFRIESTYETELEDALMTLGLTAPFDLQHGFCGLLEGNECLVIDRLIQKTFIEVNEEGTTAAAVTFAALATGTPPNAPVLFLADHPFQFFIYDAGHDLILFEGRVGAPTIPDDWPPAFFQPVHSDPDFWTSNFGLDDPPVQPTLPSTTQSLSFQSTTQSSTMQLSPQSSTTQSQVHSTTTQPTSTVDDDDDDDPNDTSALPERIVTAHWIAVVVTTLVISTL